MKTVNYIYIYSSSTKEVSVSCVQASTSARNTRAQTSPDAVRAAGHLAIPNKLTCHGNVIPSICDPNRSTLPSRAVPQYAFPEPCTLYVSDALSPTNTQKAEAVHQVYCDERSRRGNGRENRRVRRHRLLAESVGADIHIPASLADDPLFHGEI